MNLASTIPAFRLDGPSVGSLRRLDGAPSEIAALARATAGGPGEPGTDFQSMLAGADRDDAIRTAAQSLTSQALILPILKELQAGSLAWGPFGAGDAERAFRPLLDQRVADRIAASPRLPVASSIEARLRAREGGTR